MRSTYPYRTTTSSIPPVPCFLQTCALGRPANGSAPLLSGVQAFLLGLLCEFWSRYTGTEGQVRQGVPVWGRSMEASGRL